MKLQKWNTDFLRFLGHTLKRQKKIACLAEKFFLHPLVQKMRGIFFFFFFWPKYDYIIVEIKKLFLLIIFDEANLTFHILIWADFILGSCWLVNKGRNIMKRRNTSSERNTSEVKMHKKHKNSNKKKNLKKVLMLNTQKKSHTRDFSMRKIVKLHQNAILG